MNIDKIYYLNNHEDRDTKTLEDGKVVTTKEGSENYQKLLEILDDYADVYDGLNDESIKRIYFPTVVFVKDGKIVDYISGTVSSQEDPYTKLTDSQIEELENKYIDAISKMQTCDTGQKC